MTAPPPRISALRLFDYYVIEGLSAFACTILQLGLYFWARERYGFSNTENLLLGAVHGISHILGSRWGGRIADRWGYTRLMAPAFLVCGAAGLLGWLSDARFTPYLMMAVYGTSIAATWPALEGGAMHLPGRFNIPQRLGIYNLTWSLSGAAGFFTCGFLFAWDPNAVLWFAGTVHLLQLAWMAYHHGRHAPEGAAAMNFTHRGDHQSPALKQNRLRLALLANSLGFFLIGGFSALTPHLGEKLGLSASATIWLSASLLAARAVGFLVYWRWEGWHYRLVWGHIALWTPPLVLAVIFFGPSLIVVAPACLLLGATLGLSYYMSLYYALDAGDRKGEQGGLHESIIGIGILCGPLAGAAGGWLLGSTTGAKAAILLGAVGLAAIGLRFVAGDGASRND
ncbi:MAG TPA: MFS transporter [Kiritimatiellia bacterium]|nr:MFS transporter [Kiritimatiellia bacterium]HMP00535.1 MFS transporter [Kiritimatiellia bacterium]